MTHRFCSDNAVLTRDGVSRLFSGECTKDGAVAEKAVLARLLSRRLYYLAVKVASGLRREP